MTDLDTKKLLHYIAKCVTAVAVAFALSALFHYHDITWFLVSLLLVLSPDSKDAMPLALTRMKANTIGSLCGLLVFYLSPQGAIAVCLAIALTIAVCWALKAMAGCRSALAAVVIVMMHPSADTLAAESVSSWHPAIVRVIAVFAGCLLGVMVTYAFHYLFPMKSASASGTKTAVEKTEQAKLRAARRKKSRKK